MIHHFRPCERADPANAVQVERPGGGGLSCPKRMRSNASVLPCTFRKKFRQLSASQISPLTSNSTSAGRYPGPSVGHKSCLTHRKCAEIPSCMSAERGAWSLLTPVNITHTHTTRPSGHTCPASGLRRTSPFRCYFVSLFGLPAPAARGPQVFVPE